MHLSRRDLYKLTALGAAPVALAACSTSSNLENGGGGGAEERPIITTTANTGLAENFNPHSPSVISLIQGLIYETLFYFNPRAHRSGARPAAGRELRLERGRHRPDRDHPRRRGLGRRHPLHREGCRLHLHQDPRH